MAKHPVLNLVPLARTRGEVAHRDRQPQEIGQVLDRYLPEPGSTTVTAPGIRRDQKPLGLGIDLRSHLLPPTAQRLRSELGGVVIDPHAHPALVPREIVDPPGDRSPQLLVFEIIHADLFGSPLRLPFLARILEIPDQFLLLRVHRYHRSALSLEGTHLAVDLRELRVPIGMGTAFPSLAIALEAVAQIVQQVSHGRIADLMPLEAQRLG
jgi:hypothetical protein